MKTETSTALHSAKKTWPNLKKVKAEVAQKKPELQAEAKEHLKEGAKEAANALIQSLPLPSAPTISAPSVKPLSISAAKKVKEERESSRLPINKPAVFFISGFRMGGFKGPSFLEEMSKYIPDGKHFDWDQKELMLAEIKRRPLEQPVVLVGYGLGGGAALSMANELNNIKNGFRSVDLLVTVDASGTPNDIIPQNVEKHLNFIGDKGGFFHDGPHIARNTSQTEVINELSTEKDISLEENTELQYKIFEGINEVLSERVIKQDLLRILSSSEFEPRAELLS